MIFLVIDWIVGESNFFENVVLKEKSVLKKRKRKYNDEEKKNLLETDKRDDICNTKCTKCLSNLTLLIV